MLHLLERNVNELEDAKTTTTKAQKAEESNIVG